MLYNASDYKFVNAAPVANRINRNIMPVRAPDANTIATVAFEDYLFLLEAWYERMNPESAGQQNITVPPRTIIAGNIRALDLRTSGLAASGECIGGPNLGYTLQDSYYLSPETVVPASTVGQTQHIGGFLQNYALKLPECFRPYYAMRPIASTPTYHVNSVLWGEFIRAKYWAFNKMAKLLIPISNGDFAVQIKKYFYNPDGSVYREQDVSLNSTYISYARGYQTYTQQGQTTIYQDIKCEANYKQPIFILPYATATKVICHCHGQTLDYSNYNVWFSRDLSISSGGAVNLPADYVNWVCDTAESVAGTTNGRVAIDNQYLLVDFDFPARLDGISWAWQPQYT